MRVASGPQSQGCRSPWLQGCRRRLGWLRWGATLSLTAGVGFRTIPTLSTPISDSQARDEGLVVDLNRGVRGRSQRWKSLGPEPFGSALTLHRFELGNGLQVRIVPDATAPVLSFHTWYRVGSRHEKSGKTGLAHLFEHLMFNETQQLPYGEFDRVIEAAGGETNASTWTDFTQYHAELPVTALPLIIDLEAQRMSQLLLRNAQVDSEKEVVANERRYRVDDDVEGQAAELLYQTAFRKHPYHHPTIGSMADIEGFTTADCSAFYKAYYAPNNATLVLVGDLDVRTVLTLIGERYGGFKSSRLPESPSIKEPAQRTERVKVLKRPTPAAKILLGYHGPSIRNSDYTVLSIVSDLLFGGRGSRLFRELAREHELVSDLSGSLSPFHDPGLFELWFSLRSGVEPQQVLSRVDAALSKLCTELATPQELTRVANRYELGFLQSLEGASGKADQIGFHETVVGNTRCMFERVQACRNVTPGQVLDVAQRYLQPKNRTRIMVIPTGPNLDVDPNEPEAL